MSDDLYSYYEQELAFFRHSAREFGERHPAAAGRLLLEADRSQDPHVERLIEAFALLAGRVRRKLDDDFPELTEALLGVLYPHYLAPVPSLAVVQFVLDAQRSPLPDGFAIPRHSRISTRAADGSTCRYRTGYPVTLWPITVAEARLAPPPFPPGVRPPSGAAAALRIVLQMQGGLNFAELSLDRLRIHLHGDDASIAQLYELIFCRALQVVMRPIGQAGDAIVLSPADCLHQVGFSSEESLLPYPKQSLPGYALLTELFAFPTKFFFFDLGGFERVRAAGVGRQLEVLIFLSQSAPGLQPGISPDVFALGASPLVNLFEQTAEPILVNQTRFEHRIIPDVSAPETTEVYSVADVTAMNVATGVQLPLDPFYSFRHSTDRKRPAYWHSSRRASGRTNDPGTDVYLRFVDLQFDTEDPPEATVVVRTLCTNREAPARIGLAADAIRFQLEAAAPLKATRCLRAPTAPLRPPLGRGALWRLISHLSLNSLSLSDDEQGLDALRELLRLYDFAGAGGGPRAAINRQLIEAVIGVRSQRVTGRVGAGFGRGVEIVLAFDPKKCLGVGAFLFAGVLEQFLGGYVSINSFTQTVAEVNDEVLKRWPLRAGDRLVV